MLPSKANRFFGWVDDADVRVSAYWSMLSGAAGYTYGCNDIWQMYDVNQTPIIQARTGWKAALDLPMATQMGYLRQVLEKISWQELNLDQQLVLNENPKDESYALSTIRGDKKMLIVYCPTGKSIKIDLNKIESESIVALWFNPRSGETMRIGEFKTEKPQEFKPWATGRGSDFLLIVYSNELAIDW